MRASTLPLFLTVLAVRLLLSPPALTADVEVQLPAGDGFVVKDNTGAIERLSVDETTGNVSRNGALFVHTTGTSNTFIGEGAGNLSVTGLGNSAFGEYALASNTTGYQNSAFGEDALRQNTTGGLNSAFGTALYLNSTGRRNSAFGMRTLIYNTTGNDNSAFGAFALEGKCCASIGSANSAFGEEALVSNTSGNNNSAFGRKALRQNSTGDDNIAIGKDAGSSQTTGSNNIYLANFGVAGENGQIKVGTTGTHTDAFIAGIHGNVVAGSVVLVTPSGELGVAASSLRFKRDVYDMGAASDVLKRLRPVTFEYRETVDGASDGPQNGLIAEEVAELAPELVVYDDEGLPFSVRYHLLAPLLLNEVQKQQRTIEALLARVEELERQPTADATASGG